MSLQFGRHNSQVACTKQNPKDLSKPFTNNVTRRPFTLTQWFPERKPSSNLISAGLKSLRLYRHICRLIPFIIKIHEIPHRVTPLQANIYIGNQFRANSKITQTNQIDDLVQQGYQFVYEAQMHYSNTGYIYQYLMPKQHHIRDRGINRFDQLRGNKLGKQPASSFLKSFYRGSKSHDI